MKRSIVAFAILGALATASAASAYFAPGSWPPTLARSQRLCCGRAELRSAGDLPEHRPGIRRLQQSRRVPGCDRQAFLGGGQPSPSNTGIQVNQPLREGICMTKEWIIHLKSIPQDQPAPEGWSGPVGSPSVINGITYVTYYRLTPRPERGVSKSSTQLRLSRRGPKWAAPARERFHRQVYLPSQYPAELEIEGHAGLPPTSGASVTQLPETHALA